MDDEMKYLRLVSFIKGMNDTITDEFVISAVNVMEILMEEISEIEENA